MEPSEIRRLNPGDVIRPRLNKIGLWDRPYYETTQTSDLVCELSFSDMLLVVAVAVRHSKRSAFVISSLTNRVGYVNLEYAYCVNVAENKV